MLSSLTLPQIKTVFDTLYDRQMVALLPWLEDDEQAMLEYIQLVTEVQTQLLIEGGFTNPTKLKLLQRFGYLPGDIIVNGTSVWLT